MEKTYFDIIEKRVAFYSFNEHLLPPRPRNTFRHLKKKVYRISFLNRSVKANAGSVTQKIHPSLKQRTLILIQTHTHRQPYIDSLKIHARHT